MQGYLLPTANGGSDPQIARQFWPLCAAALGLLLARLWELQYGGVLRYDAWQHSMLEFFNTGVALSVFLVGWHAGTKRQTLRGWAFSITFLAVGLLNIFHLLSLPEMPRFITPNSMNKAVLFGYASSLAAAIGLLWASFLPIRRIWRLTRGYYLVISLIITLLLTFLILFYDNSLAQVWNGGESARSTRLWMGPITISLSFLLFVRFARLYGRRASQENRSVVIAAGIWVLSQAAFLLPDRNFDTYSLIGHIYKGVACGYIYQSVLMPAIERPYRYLVQAQKELRQTRRLRTLGRIVGRLAHELKNPLAAIRASAQLSAILDDEAEREKVSRRIETEVDRLSELVTLTLETGWEKQEIWDLVYIGPMVQEVNLLWAAELRRLGIASKIDVEDALPPIQGNPKLLQRALTNLVLNAVEAMPEGGELRIAAYQEASGASIRLEVSDTGPGIPDELRDYLFREFITTKPQGTGLGLMITHQIITDIHRGQIWFDTALGKGTRFLLRLPLVQAD
ncbi:MAG: hypothetical protein GX998_04690 [Firmicutes bacterium]|nr:hypothetical protein [Bacillota bacterium]